jgi:lysylphosphatidylglycerol synthetase-like protein (DUF2156 family)
MLAVDYRWWKLLHVLGVLGFVLFHGVSTMVAIRLRKERDRARIAGLLQFSGSSVMGMSVALLVATIVEMYVVARPYYQQLKDAIQLRPSGVPRKSDEELDLVLRSRLALFNAVWGILALVIITWLMIWKPTWQV